MSLCRKESSTYSTQKWLKDFFLKEKSNVSSHSDVSVCLRAQYYSFLGYIRKSLLEFTILLYATLFKVF